MLMNYHIGRLVLSSLCFGAFGAAGIWWCSFCRLKLQPAKRTHNSSLFFLESSLHFAFQCRSAD